MRYRGSRHIPPYYVARRGADHDDDEDDDGVDEGNDY